MKRFRLLVTKKISSSLVLRAGLKGVDILEKEFIRIVPLKNNDLRKEIEDLSGEKNNIVFTSRNAVLSVDVKTSQARDNWTIFCIEGATKNEVEKHFGARGIAGTAGNALALANVILQHEEVSNIVFFCGDKRLDTLPESLRRNSVTVKEIIVYKTELAPQKIVDDYDAVAFFSPTAVQSFFSENNLGNGVICLSVGKTTSEAIKQHTSNEIITAEKPMEEMIVDMAIKLSNY